jgi:plastocyanin
MKHFRLPIALGLAGMLAVTACSQQAVPSAPQGPVTPVTVQQDSLPPAPAPNAAAKPAGGFSAPAAGPNLLAKDWSQRLGVIVSDYRAPTGKPVLNPKPGDLWFFSNASTTWGATNTKNSVWVIDAKTKQTVAEVAPADGEGYSSHGIFVSGDAKFIYLPELGKNNHIDVLDGRTLEVVQTITTLGRPHHHKLWHDPNSGKDLIIGEDFNWSFSGSGVYVIDPSQNNAVVGGMSDGDFEGNPYVTTPAPDGKFIVVTVPAPMPAFRDKMDGWVAKVDPKTWKVVGLTPMRDPLWATVSLDDKYAYVTSGGEARVHKINLDTMVDEGYIQTGPGPWGAAISYDQSTLYTADKGEGPGYNQMGHTSTVVDLQTMGVKDVLNIGTTTDHALLNPDGSEVWFTSNAEHSIYIYNTKTMSMTVVKDPADGDIHGGVWVQYKDDGKGGVVGEVVADYAGLHGSALAAQRAYVAKPTLTIALNGSGFVQKVINADTGVAYRVVIKNVAGTNAGKIHFQSDDLGVKSIDLLAGESQEVQWTAPTSPAQLKAKTNKAPNSDLTVNVKQPAPTPAADATSSGDVLNVTVKSEKLQWNVNKVDVKAGQKVHFTFTNGDDEKHNLVGMGEGLNFLSPDIPAGTTASYDWTAPTTPVSFTVVCAYHPKMTFVVNVK